MLLIDYRIQQPVISLLRAIEGSLSYFIFILKPAFDFTFILSVPISDSRPKKSQFRPATHPENKTLKNRNKETISKSDTSFCALFQPILPKSGDACLLIQLGGIT
jgi:hypothetical protein